MAAPHVSGVAALMLSANSNLTSEQVSRIIKGTAQKVGGYNYQYSADHLNGTWNVEMGHGLVDAAAAVSAAAATPLSDLYIRDNAADQGTEPNTTTAPVNSSPDIVIKDLNGNTMSSIVSGESYNINVTVHNKSNVSVYLNISAVKVHWTFKTGTLLWEDSWTNAGSICGIAKHGTACLNNSLFFLNIPANGSLTVSIPWTAPTFTTSSCTPQLANSMQLTLVAEVVDGGLTIGKTATDYPLEHYVRTNNNIARRSYTMWTNMYSGNLNISPNPASGQTTVTCELSDNIDEASVVISSLTGHAVYSTTVTQTSTERIVDLQSLPVGQYIAQLIYRGEVLDAKQLVVD